MMHDLWIYILKFTDGWTALNMRFLLYALKKIIQKYVCVCMFRCLWTHDLKNGHCGLWKPIDVCYSTQYPQKKINNFLKVLPWGQTKYCGHFQGVCLDLPGFLFMWHLSSNSRIWSIQCVSYQSGLATVMLNKPGGRKEKAGQSPDRHIHKPYKEDRLIRGCSSTSLYSWYKRSGNRSVQKYMSYIVA